MFKNKTIKFVSALLAFAMLAVLLFSLPGCGDEIRRTGLDVNDQPGKLAAKYAPYTKPVPPGTWAVYWYLCGTDLETNFGCATADIEEMLRVTLPKNVTVVIETGGTREWRNNMFDAGSRERYVYTGEELKQVDSQPLSSMGDPNTFADFLYYCNANYPAEKQMVVLWDHGGGSLIGMEVDELHGRDALTLPEFKEAVEAVPAASGMYEAVGFDACLMATVDIADILRGDARYLVASEEIEPGCGWDYTGLFSALAADTSMDGARLGRAICDSYYETCAAYGAEGEITLSVTDVGRAGALLSAYRSVGDEALLLAAEKKQSYLSAFGRAAWETEIYGEGQVEMLDLGHLVENAGSLLPKNGKALLDALDDCVLYQVKGPYRTKASGLACYYNLSGDPQSVADYQALGTNEPYGYFHEYAVSGRLSGQAQAYIKQLAGQSAPGPAPLPPADNLKQRLENFPVRIGGDGRWQLDLGPELASSLAAVFVKLMYVSPGTHGGDGFRILWGTNRDLRADYQNGVFVEEFTDTWGSIDGWNVHMEPIGIEEGRILYAVPVLLNSTTGGMGEWKADEEYSLHVGCTYDADGNREYEILGAWKAGGEQRGVASKILRQLQPGDVIEPLHYPMLRDDSGALYIDYPPMGMGLLTVDENTSFYDKSVGDGYYALLFEMVDYAGNRYFSEEAALRVREGEIERLPGGIAPAATAQPAGSIAGYYISKDLYYPDSQPEGVTFYTAYVDAEDYVRMAQVLGLPTDGDASGGGYTIQIYSDKFSLEPYVGMLKVYLKGDDWFAASTNHHQRDIIFNVDEVIEVW